MEPLPIRILSIVPYSFLPAHTGGQVSIDRFLHFLSNATTLYCITTKSNQNELADYTTIPLFSSGGSRYADFRYFFRLRKIIRQFNITHIIIEHPYMGWLGMLLQKFCKVQLVVRSHNIEGLRWQQLGKWWWRMLWRYERMVHRQADYNLFITDDDRAYALTHFGLRPSKCLTALFGTERDTVPSEAETANARAFLSEKHSISVDETVLFFNGAFNYPPNREALDHILTRINPLLLSYRDLRYKMLICGKDIPEEWKNGHFENVIFAGFVDDLLPYLNGSDLFLNPILRGGGIKTKLVEALAHNLTCISFESGAAGIPLYAAEGKLMLVEDGHYIRFAERIRKAVNRTDTDTPEAFFKTFNWKNIINRCLIFLQN